MKSTSWLWVKVNGLSFFGREVNLDYVNCEFRIVENVMRSHRPRFLKKLCRFIHFKEKKAMESSDQMCHGNMKKHETKDWSHIISIWVSDLADSRALHLHYCSRSILKFSVWYSKLQLIKWHIFCQNSELNQILLRCCKKDKDSQLCSDERQGHTHSHL